MSLAFIYGAGNVEATPHLVEHAQKWLTTDRHHQVFYLVPNHIKFETELSVLNHLKQGQEDTSQVSSMRLQVFSFSRLAWFFLQNTAAYNQTRLSDAGNQMVLRKVLLDNQTELTSFKGEIHQVGFVSKLAELFSEFQAGQVTTNDLQTLINQLSTTNQAEEYQQKLKEFCLLYAKYQEKMQTHSLGQSSLISYLTNYLTTVDLKNTMFIVTGFSRFSAEEEALIHVLLQQAGNVTLHFVLDEIQVNSQTEEYQLFYEAKKTYQHFYDFARNQQLPILHDSCIKQQSVDDFSQLATFWQRSFELTRTKENYQPLTGQFRIWEMNSPYQEVTHIGKEIRRLVIEDNYRYRDISIVVRDNEKYREIIANVFSNLDIPYMNNQALEMRHHPLVEFITALMAIQTHYYRYGDIMRFLRTELFFPQANSDWSIEEWRKERNQFRQKIDRTENVMLAYGFEGASWTNKKDWQFITEKQRQQPSFQAEFAQQESSNEVRQLIQTNLPPFFTQLEQAATGEIGATLLYQFCVEMGVEQQLLFWRDQEIERGRLDIAKVHEQTWQAFVQLLDEYVSVFGNEKFVLVDFFEIIVTGLNGLTYSKVPTTIDQVQVASFDMLHPTKKPIVFILGLTEQCLPRNYENNSLMSDEERSIFSAGMPADKYLRYDPAGNLAKEPLTAYMAFLSASQKLYVSYPITSEGKERAKISPYVKNIATNLHVPIEKLTEPSEQVSIRDIGTYRSLLSDIVSIEQSSQLANQPVPFIWQELKKILLTHADYLGLTERIFASFSWKNIPERLNKQSIQQLYGQEIYASVSKIESFYQCQYKYFIHYGLQLKERSTYDLSPAATGSFFHEALDYLFKALMRKQTSLASLNEEELASLTNDVLQIVFQEPQFDMLQRSNRMNYIRYQLSKTIQRVSWALQQQSRRSPMQTLATELVFGTPAVPSLSLAIDSHHQLNIRGKIDRLDQIMVENQPYLAIVDYKSSAHRFDYRDVYYGLAMQMITYLDVALSNAMRVSPGKYQPAGAFYLEVKNPIISGALTEEERQKTLLKSFSYQGLLVNDDDLLDRLDYTIEPKEASLIYPYKQKANGEYQSRDFVSSKELNLLQKHNRSNFVQAGEQIYAGEVNLNPAYRDKQRIACQTCPFRSICQFDVMLPENNYHRIEKIDKKVIIKKLEDQYGTELGDM